MKVFSFGGGVQSTAMILMMIHGELERPDHIIFADTGWEPKPVYEHVEWCLEHAQDHGLQTHIVSTGSMRDMIINSVTNKKRFCGPPFFVEGDDGLPAMGKRQCTFDYKISPVTQKIRALIGLEKGQRVPKGTEVEVWMGISFDERRRCSVSKWPWQINHYPLVDKRMTRMMCKRWLADHGYSIPMKSSCIGCPYHSDKHWLDCKTNRPDEFQDAVEIDRLLRKGTRGMKRPSFMHRSLQPLDEVDFEYLSRQPDMWADAPDCGYCVT